MAINGFYAAYFTATAGNGFALFILKDGSIVGADMGGVKFDGQYQHKDSGEINGQVSVDAPPGATLIQGMTAGPEGLRYQVPITMPENFEQQPYIRLATPLGDVNMRLQKLREIDGGGRI